MVVLAIDLDELARRQELRERPLSECGSASARRARRGDYEGVETDAELPGLLELAKHGDLAAQELLYIRYSGRVYAFLLRIVRNRGEAEDLTQLTFMRMLTKLELYRQESGPFPAWLLRVARNLAIDQMRRRRAVPCAELPEFGVDGEDPTGELARSLRVAFSLLPSDQRAVAVQRHVLGLSMRDIAERMGRTEPSVHALHNRARKSLQTTLSGLDCGPCAA